MRWPRAMPTQAGSKLLEHLGSYLALAAFALIFATLASFTYRKRG